MEALVHVGRTASPSVSISAVVVFLAQCADLQRAGTRQQLEKGQLLSMARQTIFQGMRRISIEDTQARGKGEEFKDRSNCIAQCKEGPGGPKR